MKKEINYIKINNVSKIFKNGNGIKNLSFNIKKGSFHAIIGSNGSGKTTFIRTLLGLYQKYSGSIEINGISIGNPESYKGISYISEHPSFPNELTTENFLMWYGRLAGLNDNDIKSKIIQLAEEIDIKYLLDKKPNKFSSGEKQKIMLMKVMIENPELIIMDEPTSNLDPESRIVFFNFIERMHKEGKTIVICSHNLDEIENKVTWVTIIKNGNIIHDKEKDEERLLALFKRKVFDQVEND